MGLSYSMLGQQRHSSDLNEREDYRFRQDILKCLGQIEENLKNIREAFKVLGFGIDYRKYVRFRSITPMIWQDVNEGWHGEQVGTNAKRADLRFAIDFVVEVALRLQEFDFDHGPESSVDQP